MGPPTNPGRYPRLLRSITPTRATFWSVHSLTESMEGPRKQHPYGPPPREAAGPPEDIAAGSPEGGQTGRCDLRGLLSWRGGQPRGPPSLGSVSPRSCR
jgi:hypothetical protein